MRFSEELWKILYWIIFLTKTTFLTTLYLRTLKTIFDFARGRTLSGEHKSKITNREEDWDGKPTE